VIAQETILERLGCFMSGAQGTDAPYQLKV
jgi:hypothetical protein